MAATAAKDAAHGDNVCVVNLNESTKANSAAPYNGQLTTALPYPRNH
jgi:hypothetical protein